MAQISIDNLRQLVEANIDWRSRNESSPRELLSLSLWTAEPPRGGGVVFDPELASKTITYEGRSVTVVLDFDADGYLQRIEFV